MLDRCLLPKVLLLDVGSHWKMSVLMTPQVQMVVDSCLAVHCVENVLLGGEKKVTSLSPKERVVNFNDFL